MPSAPAEPGGRARARASSRSQHAAGRLTSRRDQTLRWLVGVAVGLLFTWLATRSWPLDTLLAGTLTLRLDGAATRVELISAGGMATWSVRLWYLAGYIAVLATIHWWRVLRWLPLVKPLERVRLGVLNRIGAIGFMWTFLLPLRLGELVRPLMLARESKVSFGAALSMIVVERVADGLMVTLLLFGVLWTVPATALARAPEVELGALAALAVFGGATAALIATAIARDRTHALLAVTVGRLSGAIANKLFALLTTFVDGLRVLRSPADVATFLLLTAGYWLTNGLGIWLMACAVELDIPPSAGFAMMCCVVVGMMIPNSPGNVGSFWYFLLLPAGLYGVDSESPRAVAFALLVWLTQLLQVSLFGAVALRAGRHRRGTSR